MRSRNRELRELRCGTGAKLKLTLELIAEHIADGDILGIYGSARYSAYKGCRKG